MTAQAGAVTRGLYTLDKGRYAAMLVHYYYTEFGKRSEVAPACVREPRVQAHPENKVTVHTYSDVHGYLADIDGEYARLYGLINPRLPAALADVARIAILHRFGGMYLDLRYTCPDLSFQREIQRALDTYGCAFEIHPSPRLNRCRNSNMAAVPGHPLFREIMQRQFNYLSATLAHMVVSQSKVPYDVWICLGWQVCWDALLDANDIPSSLGVPLQLRHTDIPAECHDLGILPGCRSYCLLWNLKRTALKEVETRGTERHWSVLQEAEPLLII